MTKRPQVIDLRKKTTRKVTPPSLPFYHRIGLFFYRLFQEDVWKIGNMKKNKWIEKYYGDEMP